MTVFLNYIFTETLDFKYFGGSVFDTFETNCHSKKSVKNRSAENSDTAWYGECEPLKTSWKATRNQTMPQTRPGVPIGTVADIVPVEQEELPPHWTSRCIGLLNAKAWHSAPQAVLLTAGGQISLFNKTTLHSKIISTPVTNNRTSSSHSPLDRVVWGAKPLKNCGRKGLGGGRQPYPHK